MDIDLSLDDEENPMSLKADFMLSLMELMVGGKDGLQPIENTVIDRCVRLMYRDMAWDPETAKCRPCSKTCMRSFCASRSPRPSGWQRPWNSTAQAPSTCFNHPTNVNLNSPCGVLCAEKLGENLRKIAMHITNDFVTSAVSYELPPSGMATWCYFDEFHILLRDPLTASYFVAVWKMLRKKGCVPSALTQNVKDLLASREIENIFENSDFIVLLSQAQGDRQILAKQLGISPHQLSYVTHTNSGEGLLFFGNTTIPFVDRFPQNTELYAIMTTRPEDKKQEMNRA